MAGPIDEDDDDVYDFKRPPGPSPREVRAGWARDGDVDALWGCSRGARGTAIDQEDVFQLLIQALEVRSRSDPERFAADVFARMTVFTTSLLLRCHLHLASYIEQSGRAVRMRAQPPGDLPKFAVDTLIPRSRPAPGAPLRRAGLAGRASRGNGPWSEETRAKHRPSRGHRAEHGPGARKQSDQRTGPWPRGPRERQGQPPPRRPVERARAGHQRGPPR